MTYHKEEPASIQTMFNDIASRYDKTNAVLSFQLHKFWNRKLINLLLPSSPDSPISYLDLCCGTGDIAIEFIKKISSPHKSYLLDFSANMLLYAKTKINRMNLNENQIQYFEADAQSIPLPNESIHCISIAYGIRNVKNPLTCIQEAYRVLKPGGRFGILELTQPKNKLLFHVHQFYLKTILPTIGNWLTNNKEAYQYLQQSIKNFIPPSHLERMMIQSQFKNTSQYPLAGGIATILIGTKPHALQN